MCYLIRQAQPEAEAQRGGTAPTPGMLPPRRRWAGAVAATLRSESGSRVTVVGDLPDRTVPVEQP